MAEFGARFAPRCAVLRRRGHLSPVGTGLHPCEISSCTLPADRPANFTRSTGMSAMPDPDLSSSEGLDLRRRDFVALSVATGVASASLPAAAIPAGPAVVEKNVTVN